MGRHNLLASADIRSGFLNCVVPCQRKATEKNRRSFLSDFALNRLYSTCFTAVTVSIWRKSPPGNGAAG